MQGELRPSESNPGKMLLLIGGIVVAEIESSHAELLGAWVGKWHNGWAFGREPRPYLA
jgi:hypothetical protein